MSSTVLPGILPGFSTPVHDAQHCFRALLEAVSRPGKPVCLNVLPPVSSLGASVPDSCLSGLVAVALTLCDADTPVWLDVCLDTPAMRQHLRFHCGCSIVSDPGAASFALIGNAETMPRFTSFFPGEPEYPDRSATLIIAARFTAAERGCLVSGPGISPARNPQGLPFCPGGLPVWFWEEWTVNRDGYPLGVDVIFVDSSPSDGNFVCIAGLPRSVSAVSPNRACFGPAGETRACMSQ
ncbi:MAG: phosphonate C-P lyase system protein PhnH [Desulfovibrio sp.]|jgi:alpha-D-ribose 1-methylphosphonate 5-triphosphate synthase subunit PhnH|nr:phosphonate C-P lyase system protein PhnH [Desulfovibrio sp.]